MSSPTYAPTITEEPYSELLWNAEDDDDGAILAMIDSVQQQEELLKKEEETLLNSLMDDKVLYADDDAVFIDDAVEELVEDFLDESEDYYYDDDDAVDDDDFAVVPAPTVGPTLPPTRWPTFVPRPTTPPMPTYFPTVTADPTYFPTVVKEQVDGIPLDSEPDDDDDDVDDDEYVPQKVTTNDDDDDYDDDDNYEDDDDDNFDDEEDYYVDDDEEDDDDEFDDDDDDDYASNYGTTNSAGISALDRAKQTIAEKEQAIEQQIASNGGFKDTFKDPNTGVVVAPASMSDEVKYAAIGGSIAAVLMLLLGCLVYKCCCKTTPTKHVAYEEHNLKDPTINGEDDIHQDGFHDEPAAPSSSLPGHGFTDQVPEPRGMHNVL